MKKLRIKFRQEIFSETDPILIQAFYARESADAIPADQIILRPRRKISPLLLPKGRFRIAALDKTGKILNRYEKISVKKQPPQKKKSPGHHNRRFSFRKYWLRR